jgi:hypothetical protein
MKCPTNKKRKRIVGAPHNVLKTQLGLKGEVSKQRRLSLAERNHSAASNPTANSGRAVYF